MTSQKISFYIPRIYGDYTVDDIIATFRLMYIGEVRRVDINMKQDDEYMSAFVHMDYLYDTEIAWNIVNDTHNKNVLYKLWVEPDVYWLIMKNLKPVADTHLNIHQLAENTRILEEKVNEQTDKIDRLENIIHKLLLNVYSREADAHNVYSAYNFMRYKNSYSGGYLSADEKLREEQLLTDKRELGELKEMEPWEDMHKYFKSLIFGEDTTNKLNSKITFTSDDDNSSSDIHSIISTSDSMPSLIPTNENETSDTETIDYNDITDDELSR